ncbi:MAG: S9 family peptidase [Tepidiformaceae bacterium]
MSLSLERISTADIARQPRPGMAAPGRVTFTPDGAAVTYLFSPEGSLVRSLWRYDIASGERTLLAGPGASATAEEQFSREEELRRERLRLRELGVTDYQFAEHANPPVFLVPGSEGVQVRRGDGRLTFLEGTARALDPRLSDDGSRVAFVRDGEMHVVSSEGGPARQLTHGAEDGLTNGLAEFIAQEELGRARGFWWSPDGRHIAFAQADSRHIPKFPIVHQGKQAPETEEHRYPFAGASNARVRLGVVDATGGEPSWVTLGDSDDVYLARVAWRPDGTLTAQVLSRDQKTLRLLAFNRESGSARCLIEGHSDPWLNLHDDLRFLDSGEFLWSTEKSGYRHLALHVADGREMRMLTSGDWAVTGLAGVDEPRHVVYFHATREDPRERHLYAVPLDGGEPRRLTTEPGTHDCSISNDGLHFIDSWHSLEHAPSVWLRSLATDAEAPTAIYHDRSCDAAALGLRPPEQFEFAAPDGTLFYGELYNPPRLEPGRRYPLIVSVYGGPHVQYVANEWRQTVDLRAQYLAQEGFVVLRVDNRGSAGRGLGFEAHLYRRMGSVEVEDQVAAVRYVSGRDYVDGDRAGIYGWSYGGYMTCLALMKAPDVFKVGVAGAPVTHYDGYDTAYTERYMETPAANPQGYEDGSVLAHVGALRGKLLIVHGMVDENVHFRHTARLIVALTNAQKDYDLLLFPEERHMPRDAKGLEYAERRIIDYFRAHL